MALAIIAGRERAPVVGRVVVLDLARILLGGAAVATLAGYLKNYLKYAPGIEGVPVWKTIHFTHLKMRFYDNQLNPAVRYAKHALSIDENRADFARVPWSKRGRTTATGASSRYGSLATIRTSAAATPRTSPGSRT
jgi:hypothetical protein